MTVAAGDLVIDSENRVDDRIPFGPLSVLGVAVMLIAARMTRSVLSGLSQARAIIDEFESAYGALSTSNGYWDHSSTPAEASRIFCDRLNAVAGWLYPFGSGVWIPVIVLWLAGLTLTFGRLPRLGLGISVLGMTALVVAAASFGSVYGDVVAVLE